MATDLDVEIYRSWGTEVYLGPSPWPFISSIESRRRSFVASQITGNSSVQFCSAQLAICKLNPPVHRFTPLTEDQWCGKRLHIMTSPCSQQWRVEQMWSSDVFSRRKTNVLGCGRVNNQSELFIRRMIRHTQFYRHQQGRISFLFLFHFYMKIHLLPNLETFSGTPMFLCLHLNPECTEKDVQSKHRGKRIH